MEGCTHLWQWHAFSICAITTIFVGIGGEPIYHQIQPSYGLRLTSRMMRCAKPLLLATGWGILSVKRRVHSRSATYSWTIQRSGNTSITSTERGLHDSASGMGVTLTVQCLI